MSKHSFALFAEKLWRQSQCCLKYKKNPEKVRIRTKILKSEPKWGHWYSFCQNWQKHTTLYGLNRHLIVESETLTYFTGWVKLCRSKLLQFTCSVILIDQKFPPLNFLQIITIPQCDSSLKIIPTIQIIITFSKTQS